jgi:hypothetical protein
VRFLQPARKVTAPDGRDWEVYVSETMRPLVRVAAKLRRTILGGVRSQQLRVEAISFLPWPESHLWLTTKDHVHRVVEQVAAGLLTGEVARPIGAQFQGSREVVGGSLRSTRPF